MTDQPQETTEQKLARLRDHPHYRLLSSLADERDLDTKAAELQYTPEEMFDWPEIWFRDYNFDAQVLQVWVHDNIIQVPLQGAMQGLRTQTLLSRGGNLDLGPLMQGLAQSCGFIGYMHGYHFALNQTDRP